MIHILPLRLSDIPDGWLEERRAVILRDKHELRPARLGNIEMKSPSEDRWLRLMLPDKAPGFMSDTDRDTVLAALQSPSTAL